MDSQLLVVVLRGLERFLVDLGGVLAIYLGYQLFLRMPSRERGEGKIELPGGVSIFVSRVGPGVFFSLFGTGVLALSLIHGVSQDETRTVATPAQLAAGEPGSVTESSHYSAAGAAVASIDNPPSEAERQGIVQAIRNLNRAPAALSADLPAAARLDIERAISVSKLRLLQSVWDSEHWGSFAQFRRWADDGENDPPPAAIAEAVRIYRAGMAQPP